MTSEGPSDDWLLLENQLCFPFYAVSRLITRAYQPLLDPLGLTYPQYLVMLALWETDGIPIQTLSDRLLLNTNTLTPLLKRLGSSGLISRRRESRDERVVTIRLTKDGRALKERARSVPEALAARLLAEGSDSSDISSERLLELRESVKEFLTKLREKTQA